MSDTRANFLIRYAHDFAPFIVAREAGASVILVEAEKDIGGHAITSGGNVALGGGSKAQKKYGIEDSPDLVFRDLTDWSVVETLFRQHRPETIVHYGEIPSAPYSQIDREHAVFAHPDEHIAEPFLGSGGRAVGAEIGRPLGHGGEQRAFGEGQRLCRFAEVAVRGDLDTLPAWVDQQDTPLRRAATNLAVAQVLAKQPPVSAGFPACSRPNSSIRRMNFSSPMICLSAASSNTPFPAAISYQSPLRRSAAISASGTSPPRRARWTKPS